MFESKLNYITAGMALAFLILLGRMATMQVVNHDHYVAEAEQMRTSISLLEPQRADIRLRDGTVVAHTESVWDVYLDYTRFADPRGMAMRAFQSPRRYEADAVDDFLKRLEAVEDAELAGPSGRRRFFLFWKLRRHPAARHDFEVCAQRLCLITGMSRGELDIKLRQVEIEVNALADALGDVTEAEGRDVSVAWLRARPAMNDPEYWQRIRRFPKSLHFAPVLAARLDWYRKELKYLQGVIEKADDDPTTLREMCFQALQSCQRNADEMDLETNPGDLTESQAQDILLEEHSSWLRLATTFEKVVMQGNRRAVQERLETLEGEDGMIARTEERLENLQERIIRRYLDDWKQRWRHYEIDEPPLLLVRDAPRDVVELLKVNSDILPGVICKRRATRQYAHARELAHVIGSVGLPDPALLDEVMARPSFGRGLEDFIDRWFDGDREAFANRFDSLVAHQMFGRSGVERVYDERLAGLYGSRVFIRDAAGRTRDIEYEHAPVHYDSLTLTIDLELQRDIARAVKEWEPRLRGEAEAKSSRLFSNGVHSFDRWSRYDWTLRGAAVVLDVETGAVLAMVSFPGYDPDRLVGRSPEDKAYQRKYAMERKIESKSGYPWWNRKSREFNRATDGTYAPGSTFKVLTSVALLDSGTVSPHDTFDEHQEKIYDGETFLGRTSHPAYDTVDLQEAIELSSNGYFYYYAQKFADNPQASWDALRAYAWKFGVSVPFESDLYANRRGSLPEPHEVHPRELAMLAIGQGKMAATPMEVARMFATVANGGKLVTPHLSDEYQAQGMELDVRPEVWDEVQEGMRRVVSGSRGTANEFDVLRRIRAAGKTGTAENGLGRPDHAWFAGYAPHDDPKVAFVFLAENSDLYGADVAPIIGECVERYLKRRGILNQNR